MLVNRITYKYKGWQVKVILVLLWLVTVKDASSWNSSGATVIIVSSWFECEGGRLVTSQRCAAATDIAGEICAGDIREWFLNWMENQTCMSEPTPVLVLQNTIKTNFIVQCAVFCMNLLHSWDIDRGTGGSFKCSDAMHTLGSKYLAQSWCGVLIYHSIDLQFSISFIIVYRSKHERLTWMRDWITTQKQVFKIPMLTENKWWRQNPNESAWHYIHSSLLSFGGHSHSPESQSWKWGVIPLNLWTNTFQIFFSSVHLRRFSKSDLFRFGLWRSLNNSSWFLWWFLYPCRYFYIWRSHLSALR